MEISEETARRHLQMKPDVPTGFGMRTVDGERVMHSSYRICDKDGLTYLYDFETDELIAKGIM